MRSAGFTLIELLVVISVMSIFGVLAFVNFKDFSSEQVAGKAAGQIQTILRLAQSNATASVVCETEGGVSWAVNFVDDKNIQMVCGNDKVKQTLVLENAFIKEIECSVVKISYSPLFGNLTFSGDEICIKNASQIIIYVDNSLKPGNPKSLTISKGGSIDVK